MIDLKLKSLTDFFEKELLKKWENNYPIFKSEEVKKWILHKVQKYVEPGRNPKKFQVAGYLKFLQQYCDYNECEDPAELLRENIDSRNQRLMIYLRKLIKDGANEATVKNAIQSRIKSFFSDRGFPLSDGMATVQSGMNIDEIILDREVIRQIQARLERPEYRIILKFQALTGLRISDVIDTLTSGKYKIEKHKDHYFIRNFRTKKRQVVINFLFFPTELSTLLKATYGDLLELDLTGLFKTRLGTKINQNNYLRRIKAIIEELDVEGNLKTHSFRKWFNSQIRRLPEIDTEFKEHLMGHRGLALSKAYNNNLKDINWVYDNWIKIIPHIGINTEVVDKVDVEILKLKKEMMKKDEQIKILLDKNIQTEKKLKEIEDKIKKFLQSNT